MGIDMILEKELDRIVEMICEGKSTSYQNGVRALSVNIKMRMGWIE